MQKVRKTIIFCILIVISTLNIHSLAADLPRHTSYYRIYNLMDELASFGLIDLNSAVKPYGSRWMQQQLFAIATNSDKLQVLPLRLRREVLYQLEEFALEGGRLPESKLKIVQRENNRIALWPPEYNYNDEEFQASIRPVLGMHLTMNDKGSIDQRWFGASFHSYIGRYIAIYGSLRDISHSGDGVLSRSGYLNNEPGFEYTQETDYSESRGGIVVGTDRYSVSLTKDQVIWGDNLNGSNIISGRVPVFPSVNLRLKPADWFELNYFHGWLVSNLTDSTRYYLDNLNQRHYRPHKKYMAANFMTFTPVKGLKFSAGNAVIYAEDQPYPGFFIPIAFYKSIDHSTTKGTGLENQNSQLFFNFSSRNINHLHVFGSVYIDEVQWRRFRPDSPDKNPVSYKVGAQLSNFPVKNISIGGEYTRSNIINYKHSIPALSYASNSYNIGHYLGDNAREQYVEMVYKPMRGLDIKLYYLDALKGNEYEYIRRGTFNNQKYTITDIISNPSPGDIIWTNQTLGMNISYELFRNAYAIVNLTQTNIQGHDAGSDVVFGEHRMTAQEALDSYTPLIIQGKNSTIKIGFSLNF
jgi:hypothetical protein